MGAPAAIALAILAWTVLGSTAPAVAAPPRDPAVVTLADTLGAAGTTGRITEQSRDGSAVAFDQSVGLAFEVTRPTLLTEVGGYVQSDSSTQPPVEVVVEIHPARPNLAPNRDVVLASAPVEPQADPRFVTYQRALFATVLQPGTYYALFAVIDSTPPTGRDAILVGSGLLETAPGTFVPFAAPLAPGAVTHPDNYDPSVRELRMTVQFAVRVLGVGVATTSDDCRAGRWKTLADDAGRPFHDAADCKRAVASPPARSA
jgi:hypothetical protein